MRGPQLGHLSSHRKGAGGSADWFSLVFRCRSLGNHRTPGTPLLDCAFVRVGLNSGSVGRRAGLGPAPTESPERRLPLRRAGCFHARAPGGPVCRPYKIRGTLRSFRRGRSQTGPGAALGRSPHPSGLTASPPTPFGLQPFPPDRGNRPSPKGEGFWAAKGRPYGENRTGSVNSARPGADAKPQQLQFPSRSGPQWGRTGPHPSTPDFARRKFSAHFKG